jgi:tetratricopeptide (TPR) repeat protein
MPRIAGFALFLAIASVVITLAGAPYAIGAIMAIPIAAIALLALIIPGPNNPGSVRIVALFALLFAALPVLKPWIDAFAFAQREKIRARQIAPIQAEFRQSAEAIAEEAIAFRELHGVYPAAVGQQLLPLIARDGSRLSGVGAFSKHAKDPFLPTAPLTVIPVGLEGFLVVSVGQDGVASIPKPADWLPLDVPGVAPTAPFAYAAIEPKRVFFNLQDSPLAPGDAVEWFPAEGENGPSLEKAFEPLIQAWERVNRESPWPDEFSRAKHPDPERDLAAARQFFAKEDHLAALCAASRSVMFRPPQPAMVKTRGLAEADKIRGLALLRLGHIRMAADALVDYVAMVPNDAEAHYHLGIALRAANVNELARRHFFAAMQVEPGSPWVAKAQTALNE